MNYTEKILHQSNYWYNDGLRKAADAGVKEAAACLRALSGKAPGKGGEKRGGFFQKLFGKGD